MRRSLQSFVFRPHQHSTAGSVKIAGGRVTSNVFLAASLRGSIYPRSRRVRSYASVVGQSSAHSDPSAQSLGSSHRTFRLGQGSVGPLSASGDEKWLALLEPYLPEVLRSPTASSFPKSGPRFPFAVNLLHRARDESNFDILSYLGVDQGRWKAVHWLVTNLMQPVTASTEFLNGTPPPSQIDWESNIPLDDATQSPVWADHDVNPKGWKHAKSPSLDDLTGRPLRPSGLSDQAPDLALRQIWQSIGFMILRAAEFSEAKSRTIMSNVYQMIAYLHHVGAVPDTIYNYPVATDPAVLQRPPTLYLLSARILTTLSDAVWRAQEEAISTEAAAVGAQFPYKGFGSPSIRHTPRVRELEHAVWLEFVLWSCLESGYIVEGAWILNEMGRRRGEGRWSTIHWSALQQVRSDGTAKEDRDGWSWSTFFKSGVIGTNEGYSDEEPLVEMGPRTISTEVVAALIDGLLSTVRVGLGSTGNTPGKIQDQIHKLMAILERDNFKLPPRVWNSVIIRLLESQKMHPEMDPASLERVLALAPTTLRNSEPGGLSTDPVSAPSMADNMLNHSNVILGLLHRTLHTFALQCDIRGARRVYARIQSFIINWKGDASPAFIADLERPMHAGDEGIYFDKEVGNISQYIPEVPEPVLAAFIDLITDAKAYEFGRWLLYSDETGGSVVRFFSSVTVASALLRFAAATADSDLLKKVTSALVVPLPEGILRTMFQCHIALSDWEGVEKFLLYLKDQRELGWGATEAAALARAVMLLDKTTSLRNVPSLEMESFQKARNILQKLLHGQYNTTQLPSERRENLQIDLLAQLIRIFKTIPGAMAELCQEVPDEVAQPSKSVDIPVNAFNILLDAVVSTKGSLEGRRMWHMWCKDPGDMSRLRRSGVGSSNPGWIRPVATALDMKGDQREAVDLNGVVQPNLTTLRTILQAAVAERRASIEVAGRYFSKSRKDIVPKRLPMYRFYRPTEVLDWGSAVLRKFGLRENTIDAELGGYLYRRKRPFVKEARTLAKEGQDLNKNIRSSTKNNRFSVRKYQSLPMTNSEPNHSRPER